MAKFYYHEDEDLLIDDLMEYRDEHRATGERPEYTSEENEEQDLDIRYFWIRTL